MRLSPIPGASVDPRLAPHLEPGETLLWQGRPEVRSINNLAASVLTVALFLAGLAGLLGLWPLIYPPLATASGSPLIPGLVLMGAGVVFFALNWHERDANWRYAVTDRRLMVVRGKQLFRTAVPAQLRRLRILGRMVYWDRESDHGANNISRRQRYIGFRGMRDPQAVKDTIEAWRDGFSTRAAETAKTFLRSVASGEGAASTRVVHPGSGLRIDVPAGWTIRVSDDHDGPLRLFGLTLLPRIIRRGEERAWGDGKPWTTLMVRGAPDAGLYLVVHSRPLTQTLERVMADPLGGLMGLRVVRRTPYLEVGALRGFSVTREYPAGARLVGVGEVGAAVAARMVWLGTEDMSVEITGVARLDQEEVQDAIDAMVDSISLGPS